MQSNLLMSEDRLEFGSRLSDRVIAGFGSATLLVGSFVVAYLDPTKTTILPACPLLTLTGFACPGCGLTRGFHSLFHGDLIVAIDFNALIFVWAAIVGWVTLSLALVALRGRGLFMWPTQPRFMTTFAAVLLTFGVLRNIPVWPLTILFP